MVGRSLLWNGDSPVNMIVCLTTLEVNVIKVIGTAYKRDDFTTQEFFDYWRDVHAPISAKIGPMRGYVVSEVISKVQGEIHTEAFIEQWWDDVESFERAAQTPEMAVAWEDVSNYAKTTGTFWVTREHVYIPPPIPRGGTLSRQAWLA